MKKSKESKNSDPSRFSLFNKPDLPDPDRVLDMIENQILRISLHVSYIENRLSDFETRTDNWREGPIPLEDIPLPGVKML